MCCVLSESHVVSVQLFEYRTKTTKSTRDLKARVEALTAANTEYEQELKGLGDVRRRVDVQVQEEADRLQRSAAAEKSRYGINMSVWNVTEL